MTNTFRTFSFLFALLLTGTTIGCDSGSAVDDTPEPLETVLVTDLPADPIVGIVGGRPVGAGLITYFSLRTNSVVPDSASMDWDLAFQGTSIFVNGGTSGPGGAGVVVMESLFEEVVEAPAEGYTTDSVTGLAIPAGSGLGWYNYNPATMTISPIPGRILVVRTADGRFAKVRVLNYYQGSPAEITQESVSRYYSFEFVFQPSGSHIF